MKKFLVALLVLMCFVPSLTAEAWGSYYSITVQAGGSRRSSTEMKKIDTDPGAVTPNSGLNGVYVTYRIRFYTGGGLATNYVDAHNYQTYTLPYYGNLAIKGERYILASSMDAGQSRNSTTTTGKWAP